MGKSKQTIIDMSPSRVEAFSDGVLAIVITIMVLELHVPHSGELSALRAATPTLLTYAISFAIIAIYWNNHHHLLRSTKHISPIIMWTNLFFLFWISLIPFATSWMGEFHTRPWPVASYAILLAICALAYNLLQRAIIRTGGNAALTKQIGNDTKGIWSLLAYIAAAPLAFITPWLAYILFVAVALAWFIPDRRLAVRNEYK